MKKFHFIALLSFLFSLLLGSSSAFAVDTSFSPSQVKDIQKIVHDYLIKNPSVLIEASQALQKQQMVRAEKDAMTAIQKNKQQIFQDPKTPSIGNPSGSVYLVEFFDYQCGHCKAMDPVIEALVKNNKNVKVIFKELPIFGGASRYAAKMALASTAQGKYYAFHNALLHAKKPLNKSLVLKIARKVSLNTAKLQKDAKAPWIAQQLRANFKLAQTLKLVGTPAFIVANQGMTKFRFIPGATSPKNLNEAINAVNN